MQNLIRSLLSRTGQQAENQVHSYQDIYERHAQEHDHAQAVGAGDFETIGRIELSALQQAGLQENSRLFDLGCGVGRLAVHAIPFLQSGAYCGVDIAPTMIREAKQLTSDFSTEESQVSFHVSDDPALAAFSTDSFDFACAFSVFTHMDLEDTFLYFQGLRRIVTQGGKLLCSHILLSESEDAKNIFNMSSAQPYAVRRSQVICTVTARELINTIAEMSGWNSVEWIAHDAELFDYNSQGDKGALGQAIAILR